MSREENGTISHQTSGAKSGKKDCVMSNEKSTREDGALT